MWHSNACYTTFPTKFTWESHFKQYLFILCGDFINISIRTDKKRVKIKLSKFIIVGKVESLWTSVNKWMTMAMTGIVVFICTFIYRFTYQYIVFHLYVNCRNPFVIIGKRDILFPGQVLYPVTNVSFALGAWHVISISWSIYLFRNNFKEWGSQLCHYCLRWYDSINVRYVYLSDSQVSSVK